jgi:HSP20 family protein
VRFDHGSSFRGPVSSPVPPDTIVALYNTTAVAHLYRDHDSDPERGGRGGELRVQDLLEEDPSGMAAGECSPPIDVLETAAGIEIVMDLPGVSANTLRVLFSRDTIVVAGRKLPGVCVHQEAAFHLAERSFGRFARAVRLTGAFDAGNASATLEGGELRIVLPRVDERRGREIHIRITQP